MTKFRIIIEVDAPDNYTVKDVRKWFESVVSPIGISPTCKFEEIDMRPVLIPGSHDA